MKRHLTAVIVATLLASTPALAAEHEGWFVDGLLGFASIDDNGIDDDAVGASFNLGYRWGVFGVEGGFVDFGNFEDRETFPAPVGDIDTDLDLDGWKLGINLHGNINDNWSLMAHGGAFFWTADAHFAQSGIRVSSNDDAVDWYAGVGIDYNFNPNFSLGLGYDYYELSDGAIDSSINTFGLRGEFRF